MTDQLCVVSVTRVISIGAVLTGYELGEHVAIPWENIHAVVEPPEKAVSEVFVRQVSQVIYRPTGDAPKPIREFHNLKDFTGKEREGPCVYFLCLADELVYIGSTLNLRNRISRHKDSKQFDAVFWIPIGMGHNPKTVESKLIRRLRPVYNIKDTGRHRRDNRILSVHVPGTWGNI